MNQVLNKKELDNCNFGRTALMTLVVLQHSMALYTGAWGPFAPAQASVVFQTLSAYISSFHIYGFVLVSGYVFYYIKCERGGMTSTSRSLSTKQSAYWCHSCLLQ